MNIKKIIKEEIDDFSWVSVINPFDYYISNNGMTMILNREVVEFLLRKEGGGGITSNDDTILYKRIEYRQSGGKYTMLVYFYPTTLSNGVLSYKVIGRSGDYGWGFRWLSNKNVFGKQVRNQIFRKIIEDINS